VSDKQVFILATPEIRRNAERACSGAPDGWLLTIEPPKKSRPQEALYHTLFSQIAKSRQFMGKKHDAETWKRLIVDSFARIKASEGEPIQGHGSMIPNLDQTGFVQLGVQTRRFTKSQASEFIEFVHAWMSETEDE